MELHFFPFYYLKLRDIRISIKCDYSFVGAIRFISSYNGKNMNYFLFSSIIKVKSTSLLVLQCIIANYISQPLLLINTADI